MVWATSEKLGCAINRCDNIFPQWPKPIYLLACQYKPPGNFFRKKPYEEGAPCTQCPEFSTCKDKQCSSKLL
ncbi:unnamed protein product [Hydatigera taeniaeformis]|uniref:SCP domain-containing protein n=1 Tax=Hydatigena taeniaeformis TaxID=6205 RepID=A0A0R3XB15_HYDTA|nr:unnamed protein product [Hydatigera taeniaeformis]